MAYGLPDGHAIESVLMPYQETWHRSTHGLGRCKDLGRTQGRPPDCMHFQPGTVSRRDIFRDLFTLEVGCAMGCVFCATGQMGFKRHLTSSEIFEQVLGVDRYGLFS